MKLYGSLASPYVARVVLFARLKGVDLEPQLPPGGIKSPTYLALNPMGKMPVLEYEGIGIPESEVICEFLADALPGPGGLPGSPKDRARARSVSRVFDIYVSPHMNALFGHMDPAVRDARAVEAGLQGLATGCGYLEQLVGTPFAAGAQATLADCALLPSFALMKKTLYPVFNAPDPTLGTGNLAHWWSAAQRDVQLQAFLDEYYAALDAFMKALAEGG